ncbi:MAG: histidine kinase [Kaiparowitsia implicata GSE-PSE-MK54-09C]|jgi:hypothetical protein|nr:histidine kinase [Kaiparowitsia implicata GSE-PSE-MK54-09C]
MPTIPCHILVDGNPIVIYASRNGAPTKMLPILTPFLERFWQEREFSSETDETPDVLVAQLIVRFGFEFSEDDFSNLKAGLGFDPRAEYIYKIEGDRTVSIYIPQDSYREDPSQGLQGCRRLEEQLAHG